MIPGQQPQAAYGFAAAAAGRSAHDKMKRAAIALGAAVAHMGLLIGLLLLLGSLLNRDTNFNGNPNSAERLLGYMISILKFPVFTLGAHHLIPAQSPIVLKCIPAIVNSLLWGSAIAVVLGGLMRKRIGSTDQ